MRAALKLVVLAALVAIAFVALRRFDLTALLDPEAIGAWLDGLGPLAPLALIGAVAVAVVVSPIPTVPLDIAAGTAFGPWFGTLYAATGALLGAIVSFLLARALGREFLERFLSGHIQFCSECSDHLLTRIVLVSRLVPVVSFDLVSYGAGLTKMSLRNFSLATFVGMLPLTWLYVTFGSVVISSPGLAVALGAALVVAFFLLPRWIERNDFLGLKKVFRHAEPDPQGAGSGAEAARE